MGGFDSAVVSTMFSERRFLTSSVDTKTFVLMLANSRPKSLVSGSETQIGRVMSAGNRSEFHHIFPQSFLKSVGIDRARVSCLANFCIISAADNKRIGGKQPSVYRSKLSTSVIAYLPSHIIPDSLFTDDFSSFIEKRSHALVAAAYKLMARDPDAAGHKSIARDPEVPL